MEENTPPSTSPRSLHSRIGTPVRFINRSRSRVKVLWLNYQGEQVLYSTLEPSNGRYDVNTYVTHPWIALEEPTNAVMLLNFRKIYFPVAPGVRRIENENRDTYVRSEVFITPNGNQGALILGCFSLNPKDGPISKQGQMVHLINLLVPYPLQDCCKELLKKIVLPQNINQLPLPQTIIRQIVQSV